MIASSPLPKPLILSQSNLWHLSDPTLTSYTSLSINMATERLIHEVKTNDLPKIDLGNFAIQPVDRVFRREAGPPVANGANGANGIKAEPKSIAQQFLSGADSNAAPALTNAEFPLNLLENKTFAGTGYNTIWRPRSGDPIKPIVAGSHSDVLELNLTAETMAFSKSLGDVPNRGIKDQKDLMLKGISYVQRVGAFENPDTGSNDSPNPVGIHFEPGLFMFVPKSDKRPKGQPATINRMASIPHGTSINAQGVAPSSTQQAGKPDLAKDIESIVPFNIGDPTSLINFPHLNFDGKAQENRLPNPLTDFKSTQDPTVHVFWCTMLMTSQSPSPRKSSQIPIRSCAMRSLIKTSNLLQSSRSRLSQHQAVRSWAEGLRILAFSREPIKSNWPEQAVMKMPWVMLTQQR